MEKTCRVCAEKLYGRTDQRFCSDRCRNRFHNQKRKQEHAYLRAVDRILRRNRSVLRQLWEDGYTEVAWERLLRLGFAPAYCTGWLAPRQGKPLLICYDMALEFPPQKEAPGSVRITPLGTSSSYREPADWKQSDGDQSCASMGERVMPSSMFS
jgi:hypothetical protein